MNEQRNRYRGAMLGLACGDAVGTTVEFSARGTFEPVTDMVGGYGLDVAKLFAERNGCSEAQPAAYDQNRADMQAARDADPPETEHRCMDWDGCTINPVRFCVSSEIVYSDVTHGWPTIGGQLIGEFQTTLK